MTGKKVQTIEGEVLMPGDRVPAAEELAKNKTAVILGPGLRRVVVSATDTLAVTNTEQATKEEVEEERPTIQVVAYKAGRLQHRLPATFWVENYQRRYVPVRGDAVIGVVTTKSGDIFRVDIGAHEQASLSYLAFESATKKNRPDVNVGDLVYGRLIVASRDMEPEMVCVNSSGKKDKLGVLNTDGGFVFVCSLNLARKVLREQCPLLRALTKEIPYELAVGLNGRIWVRAHSVRETIAVGNAILAAEFASAEEITKICENVANILFS